MELIEKQMAINAFMTATSDGDKADWCVSILKSLPTVQYDPEWHECFDDDPASFPDDDRLVLISFSNYPVPTVGWFMHVDDGGFWTDGMEKSFVELGLFVDGWWELPKKPEGRE